MAVQTLCPSCSKQQEPYMDPKSEKVYCGNCDQEMIANHFLTSQLKTLKQYKQKSTAPFSIKCLKCNKEGTPIMLKDISCAFCKTPLSNLTPQFKLMLKQFIK